jgi:hypothetical protein
MTETKADQTVERGSRRLHDFAQKAADRGGLAGKLAAPLEDDAQFLRKLKPSLIAARIRGQAPIDEKPRPSPQPTPRRRQPTGSGRNPVPLIGAAAAAGFVLAKLLDWRGHAHPRL